jgi:hypothetical protein
MHYTTTQEYLISFPFKHLIKKGTGKNMLNNIERKSEVILLTLFGL